MRDVPFRLRLVALVVFVLALVVQPSAASAHTGLEFSDPADGDTVSEPVSEVTVGFTSEVELVGEGFEALDPQGNLRKPQVISDDDRVFTLLFDPPLAGGGVGVRLEVRAPDGHVLSDSFSFVVDAPLSTPATTEPVGTPATTAPAPEPTEPPAPGSTTSVVPTSTAAPTTAGATTTTTATVDAASDGSNTGIVLAIAAAAAIGVGGFFLIRSRTSGAP